MYMRLSGLHRQSGRFLLILTGHLFIYLIYLFLHLFIYLFACIYMSFLFICLLIYFLFMYLFVRHKILKAVTIKTVPSTMCTDC